MRTISRDYWASSAPFLTRGGRKNTQNPTHTLRGREEWKLSKGNTDLCFRPLTLKDQMWAAATTNLKVLKTTTLTKTETGRQEGAGKTMDAQDHQFASALPGLRIEKFSLNRFWENENSYFWMIEGTFHFLTSREITAQLTTRRGCWCCNCWQEGEQRMIKFGKIINAIYWCFYENHFKNTRFIYSLDKLLQNDTKQAHLLFKDWLG